MDNESVKRLISDAYNLYRTYEDYKHTADFTRTVIKCNEERERLFQDPKFQDKTRLEPYGYRVYSQNDEDGVIAEIFNRIGTTSKFFIEFGVEKGVENNTLYLLLQDWSGVWLDGNSAYVDAIYQKFAHYIRNRKLTAVHAMITRGNIDMLFEQTGCTKQEVDLLSIDIDGNDYHVLEAITVIKPRVIVIEYNAKFPPPMRWVMQYNPNHMWDGSDMQGMSLTALEELAAAKGYQLAGTNITGTNAFLVRKDLAGNLFTLPASAENLYNPPRYYLQFYRGHELINAPLNGFL
ncbi:MAG: FkbM family methyltransferase [Sporomusaceae bacterium]|jgi:hypothetical protein|nr:FkbM family methyltransferase [Sporomusaceae bacterium]